MAKAGRRTQGDGAVPDDTAPSAGTPPSTTTTTLAPTTSAPMGQPVSSINVAVTFDEAFDTWLELGRDEPADLHALGRIIAGRTATIAGNDWMPGNDVLDVLDATLARKIATLIPEKYRTETIAKEMWLAPFLGAIARLPDEGGTVNGQHFEADEVAEAKRRFEARREAEVAKQQGDAAVMTAGLDPEMIGNRTPADIGTEIISKLLDPTAPLDITIDPTLDETTSVVVSEPRNKAVSEGDETLPAAPSSPVDDYMTSTLAALEAAGVGAAQRPPAQILSQNDVEELFRADMMSWEELVAKSQARDLAWDSQTGEMVGTGKPLTSATVAVDTSRVDQTYTQRRTGRTLNVSVPRRYSPLAAANLLYSMSPEEIVNLQDKLVRAGFIEGEAQVRRGDPTDAATAQGWRAALAVAMRSRQPVLDVIRGRVRTAINLDQARAFGNDWAQDQLGRNLTTGEAMMLRNYVTSLSREPTQGTLGLEDQAFSFLQDRFREEAGVRRTQAMMFDLDGAVRGYMRRTKDEEED